MTREIKFRAWFVGWKGAPGCVEESARMVYDIQNGGGLGWQDGFADYLDEADYIIEQYTGLKDKNGKEIYEGDVVKYLSWGKDYIGQVVFDFVDDSEGYYIEKHYGWGICRNGYNTSLGDYVGDNMKCNAVEVIGNIHENPELLK